VSVNSLPVSYNRIIEHEFSGVIQVPATGVAARKVGPLDHVNGCVAHALAAGAIR
jgi:hypothetical protein